MRQEHAKPRKAIQEYPNPCGAIPESISRGHAFFLLQGAGRWGYYPLDDALGLSDSSKQYDVQDVEAWLSSESACETASETYERITGVKLSEHHKIGRAHV